MKKSPLPGGGGSGARLTNTVREEVHRIQHRHRIWEE